MIQQWIRQYFYKKDRRLGRTDEKRIYDLPLNKDSGATFLSLLVGLMTFLALCSLMGSFVLHMMSAHWSSGLENKVTIEIPAETDDGDLRSKTEIQSLSERIKQKLSGNGNIKKLDILNAQDVQALIEPWLGDDALLADLPLPGLIAIDLYESSDAIIRDLQGQLQNIVPDIVIDTHEQWLTDLVRMTSSLQFAAIIIMSIVGITTIIAISSAVRSRVAIYHDDVELLHLMGAGDHYITRQFQRHAFILAMKGAIGGFILALVTLISISLISGQTGAAFLPEFSMSLLQILIFLCLPAIICVLSALTARLTVLHELGQMP